MHEGEPAPRANGAVCWCLDQCMKELTCAQEGGAMRDLSLRKEGYCTPRAPSNFPAQRDPNRGRRKEEARPTRRRMQELDARWEHVVYLDRRAHAGSTARFNLFLDADHLKAQGHAPSRALTGRASARGERLGSLAGGIGSLTCGKRTLHDRRRAFLLLPLLRRDDLYGPRPFRSQADLCRGL